ncbi:MAG: L,D-transpeptidase family protein [Chthoniobacterales bacterium]|nr:L,D-transpeptidase family protein [Chthoniobacterales bacterium]MCX7713295.1 L,D-transpeptidase family protein [Chthoniobacterales bacterium]
MKSLCYLLASGIVLLSGCVSYDPRLNSTQTPYLGSGEGFINHELQNQINYAESISYWDGDGVPGEPRIIVSISRQRAYFYKGDKLVGVSAISTGRDGFDTPPGKYSIIEKKEKYRSNLYGNYVDAEGRVVKAGIGIKIDPQPPGTRFEGAPMPYWMRLTRGGVGLHAGFLPGVPDSRGCIRLPERMAKAFFANAPIGTPVEILP